MTPESLGERLKRLRRALKLSQDDLAEKSGVPRRTIQNIEHGAVSSPHADTISGIALALGVSVHELQLGKQQTGLVAEDVVRTLLEAAKNKTELSAEESDLLAVFRALRPDQRKSVADFARNIAVLNERQTPGLVKTKRR